MGLLNSTYSGMAPGDWSLLKQQVAIFFQGKKVKVSLFLAGNIQAMDGTLSIDTSGRTAKGTPAPGTITVLKGKDKGIVKTFETHSCSCEENGGGKFFDSKSHIGENAYEKDRNEESYAAMEEFWSSNPLGRQVEQALLDALGGEVSVAAYSGSRRLGESKEDDDVDDGDFKEEGGSSPKQFNGVGDGDDISPTRPKRLASAAEEFNLLADLMGTAVSKTEEEDVKPIKMTFDNFVLSPDDDEEGTIQTVVFNGSGRRQTVDERFESLGFDDVEEGKAEGKEDEKSDDDDSEDDLLDLMDSVKDD